MPGTQVIRFPEREKREKRKWKIFKDVTAKNISGLEKTLTYQHKDLNKLQDKNNKSYT